MPPDDGDLRTVRILRFPLTLWRRASEHHEELMREFALLAIDPPQDRPGHDVPQRLIELIDVLGRQFAGSTEQPDALRDAALSRGERSVDLEYSVPLAARDASVALGAMLEEADDFCRRGEQLLTLATPPDALAFRRWYLDEFVGQIDGKPPTPWPGALD